MNTVEQARKVSERMRLYPSGKNEIEIADTIDALIAKLATITTELNEYRDDVASLNAELAALKSQEPVAWKFRFNNGTFCTVYTALEASDVRKHLDINEVETELFPAAGAQPVPAGYQLVPIEPTEAMLEAGPNAELFAPSKRSAYRVYKAMLAAAKEKQNGNR